MFLFYMNGIGIVRKLRGRTLALQQWEPQPESQTLWASSVRVSSMRATPITLCLKQKQVSLSLCGAASILTSLLVLQSSYWSVTSWKKTSIQADSFTIAVKTSYMTEGWMTSSVSQRIMAREEVRYNVPLTPYRAKVNLRVDLLIWMRWRRNIKRCPDGSRAKNV